MKNQELFNKTISILVNAYQKDVLDYYDCKACAVGNIVAANKGYGLKKVNGSIRCDNEDYCGDWADAIELGCGRPENNLLGLSNVTFEEIERTGYTIPELAKVEEAFAIGCDLGDGRNQNQFQGLMKVVDYLMTIHEANEAEIKEAKELFVQC